MRPLAIPVSEAKGRLSELVRAAEQEGDVLLVRHGQPAAFIVSVDRLQGLIDTIDDLEDRLSIYETADEESVPLEKVKAHLGLL